MSFPSKLPIAPTGDVAPAVPLDTEPAPRRRWTLRALLVASHAGLLAVVVAVFAGAVYWMISRGVYRQAEADLLAAAQLLLRELDDGTLPADLRIPDTYFHRFGPAPRDQASFALWDSAGTKLAASGDASAGMAPLARPPRRQGPHPFEAVASGSRLDVVVTTPAGGQLRMGRPLAKEFDGLQWLALQLLAGGAGALVIGSVAATWLARRISAPLVRMSRAAERISSRNLKDRLETGPATEEVVGLAAVFNRMLAGLDHAFDRQTRFTADASHELRTPVAVILAQAEHSLARERSPEDYRSALGTCRDAALRMKRLVGDLLLLSRGDAGQLLTRRGALDLAEVAGEAARLLEPLAREREIRLTTRLIASPMTGDGDQLGQVVTNLVTNAIQYNEVGGEVEVTVEPRGGGPHREIVLTVADRGPGIPIENQATLFDRFTRGDAARTHAGAAGTGLGLSIVREIVEAHGGTIEVRSAAGSGTSMTVRFPATELS